MFHAGAGRGNPPPAGRGNPPPAGRGHFLGVAAAGRGHMMPPLVGPWLAPIAPAALPPFGLANPPPVVVDPNVFPGFNPVDRTFDWHAGYYVYRGRPLVSPSLFFTEPVSLVNRRSARSPPVNHSTFIQGGYVKINSVTLSLRTSTVLTNDMERCLVVPDDTRVLLIENITWLHSLPCLSSLPLLTKLVLDDLPVRGLPSLGPLINLRELEMIDLVDMQYLPVGIGDAPRLRILTMSGLIDLEEFSIPLIRRLASGHDPLRLKNLHIEKCGCAVPDEIGELLGLEELWLVDTMDERDLIPFPDIGRTLTALRTLTVIGYLPINSLPKDMSGLTSLERLKLKHVGIDTFDSSLGQLKALKELIVVSVDVEQVPKELAELVNLEVVKFKECDWLVGIECNFFKTCPKMRKINFCIADGHQRDIAYGDSVVYWQLAQMVPDMRDLNSIVITGAFEDEIEALADAFKCWPLQRVEQLMFDHGFYNYWRGHEDQRESTLPLTAKGLDGWYDIDHRLRAIFGEWRLKEAKMEAFAMSQHGRLGVRSLASAIDGLAVTMIVDSVMGRPAFKDKWEERFRFINESV